MTITEKIVSAVSKAIYEEFHNDFGNDMVISKEDVNQNLEDNTFTITAIKPSLKRETCTVYKNSITINICYFPSITKESNNKKIYDVIERLDKITDILKVSEDLSIHGTNQDNNVNDNVLTYVVSFDTRVFEKTIYDNLMESIEINMGVK